MGIEFDTIQHWPPAILPSVRKLNIGWHDIPALQARRIDAGNVAVAILNELCRTLQLCITKANP